MMDKQFEGFPASDLDSESEVLRPTFVLYGVNVKGVPS